MSEQPEGNSFPSIPDGHDERRRRGFARSLLRCFNDADKFALQKLGVRIAYDMYSSKLSRGASILHKDARRELALLHSVCIHGSVLLLAQLLGAPPNHEDPAAYVLGETASKAHTDSSTKSCSRSMSLRSTTSVQKSLHIKKAVTTEQLEEAIRTIARRFTELSTSMVRSHPGAPLISDYHPDWRTRQLVWEVVKSLGRITPPDDFNLSFKILKHAVFASMFEGDYLREQRRRAGFRATLMRHIPQPNQLDANLTWIGLALFVSVPIASLVHSYHGGDRVADFWAIFIPLFLGTALGVLLIYSFYQSKYATSLLDRAASGIPTSMQVCFGYENVEHNDETEDDSGMRSSIVGKSGFVSRYFSTRLVLDRTRSGVKKGVRFTRSRMSFGIQPKVPVSSRSSKSEIRSEKDGVLDFGELNPEKIGRSRQSTSEESPSPRLPAISQSLQDAKSDLNSANPGHREDLISRLSQDSKTRDVVPTILQSNHGSGFSSESDQNLQEVRIKIERSSSDEEDEGHVLSADDLPGAYLSLYQVTMLVERMFSSNFFDDRWAIGLSDQRLCAAMELLLRNDQSLGSQFAIFAFTGVSLSAAGTALVQKGPRFSFAVFAVLATAGFLCGLTCAILSGLLLRQLSLTQTKEDGTAHEFAAEFGWYLRMVGGLNSFAGMFIATSVFHFLLSIFQVEPEIALPLGAAWIIGGSVLLESFFGSFAYWSLDEVFEDLGELVEPPEQYSPSPITGLLQQLSRWLGQIGMRSTFSNRR